MLAGTSRGQLATNQLHKHVASSSKHEQSQTLVASGSIPSNMSAATSAWQQKSTHADPHMPTTTAKLKTMPPPPLPERPLEPTKNNNCRLEQTRCTPTARSFPPRASQGAAPASANASSASTSPATWVWGKSKPPGDGRFLSLVPLKEIYQASSLGTNL